MKSLKILKIKKKENRTKSQILVDFILNEKIQRWEHRNSLKLIKFACFLIRTKISTRDTIIIFFKVMIKRIISSVPRQIILKISGLIATQINSYSKEIKKTKNVPTDIKGMKDLSEMSLL